MCLVHFVNMGSVLFNLKQTFNTPGMSASLHSLCVTHLHTTIGNEKCLPRKNGIKFLCAPCYC